MDELWQRYRAFWTPVLWGVGVFLVGLIVVHILTDDPEVAIAQNATLARQVKGTTTPVAAQTRAARENADRLHERVLDWAKRLDQRHGESADFLGACVAQALRAALLRGSAPGDASAFDGDAAAALEAKQRYDALVEPRLNLLRTQDPNIGFTQLLADVVGELSVRANRADVDVNADEFGFGSVASVDRASLTRYVANLALVATFVDAAIRAGVRSIDAVDLQVTEPTHARSVGPDGFVTEWPVTVTASGDPRDLLAVLAMMTDPARPTAIGTSTWKLTGTEPDRRKGGIVQAQTRLYSVRVQPGVGLGLETEE